MKRGDTFIMKQGQLEALGISLDALGITSHKNRPYVVIASNRQMTWLAPLTTVLKRAHGRVVVAHVVRDRFIDCEVVTTDMFSIKTDVLSRVAITKGKLTHASMVDVVKQLTHSITIGRLGVPV